MFRKVKNAFKIACLTVLTVTSFLFVLPPVSASAAGELPLSKYSGAPGDTVQISYTFGTVTNGLAVINFNGIYLGTAPITNHSFAFDFKVPVLPRGTYTVSVTVEGSGAGFSDDFTIKPKIYINDKDTTVEGVEASVGDGIVVKGNGFSPGKISFYIDNSTTAIATSTADGNGVLEPISIEIPPANKAVHLLKAVDSAGSAGSVYAQFSVAPSLKLSSETCGAGEQITITGNGFAGSSIIDLKIATKTLSNSTIVTDVNGTFSVTVNLPLTLTKGSYVISATDNAGNKKTTNLVIKQSLATTKSFGMVGDTITVRGASFDPGVKVTVSLNNLGLVSTQTDNYGAFTMDLCVPELAQGQYQIKAVDANQNEAVINFTVNSNIKIVTDSGKVGAVISVGGNGFADRSDIVIYFNDENVGTAKTNSVGTFSTEITIPRAPFGEYLLKTSDESGNKSEVTFNIIPAIAVDNATVLVGDSVVISGNGFAASSSGKTNKITLSIDGINIAATENEIFTDSLGSFTAILNMPAKTGGAHTVKAVDSFDNAGSVSITIAPSVASDIETGIAGETVQISGYGFGINKDITVKYNNAVIKTAANKVTTDINGSFQAAFTLPDITAGVYNIEVSDGISSAVTPFNHAYETVPPPAVGLIAPIEKNKAPQPIVFSWSASSDPSGVFYKLQIATDSNFTKIIFNQDNLDSNNYMMSAENKLDPVSVNNPYYWRVKAVDGVGNESAWVSDAFVVGSGWPLWLTYLLVGIGGFIVLVILGIWVGKRTAMLKDDSSYNYSMDADIEYRYRKQYPSDDLG